MSHPPSTPILAALGPDARAMKLVHAAFWRAREEDVAWWAVHVELPDADQERSDQARLWLQEAEGLGATPLWLRAGTLTAGLLEALRKSGARDLMLGQGAKSWFMHRLGYSWIQDLQRRAPAIQIHPISIDPASPRIPLWPPKGRRMGALFSSIAVLGGCTGLGAILPPEQNLPALFLLFLLGTVFGAERWGKATGLLACLASVGIFHLGFAPRHASHLSPGLLTGGFGAFLLAGQSLQAFAQGLRRQKYASRRRAALLTALLLLGRQLAKASNAQDVSEILARLGEGMLHRPILLHLKAEGLPADQELIFRDGWAYLPLGKGEHLQGALSMAVQSESELSDENRELFHAFAVQAALALERLQWMEKTQAALLDGETERMKSTLLAAISHDLRTPLAAIQGAASSLLLAGSEFPESTRQDLLAMISEESQRLTHLLTNLLELTRLESGAVQLQKEWHSLQEILNEVWQRMGMSAQDRLEIPADLPLLRLDGQLLGQLVQNLLQNARRHAPGSAVSLTAWTEAGRMELQVSDQGPGIRSEDLETIFNKFYRAPGCRDGGVGLGLAICDAIARAHDGRIWAENPTEGGSRFRVSLPLEPCPAIPEEPS